MADTSVDTFLSLFNRIDKHIKQELAWDQSTDFGAALREWGKRKKGWRFAQPLKLASNVRNVLVHDLVKPGGYLAHPSREAIALLHEVIDDLERPARVIPRFQQVVATLQVDDSLTSVLKSIAKADYSQFPVYDGTRFKGLLTENGIVRHLASLELQTCSLLECDDIRVRVLLSEDQNKRNYEFVPRTMRLDEALARFAAKPVLEAILVTANGAATEKLLGIMTRWDALEAHKMP